MRGIFIAIASIWFAASAWAASYPSPVFQALTVRGCTGLLTGNGTSPASCSTSINLASGSSYQINGTTVLSRNTTTPNGSVSYAPFLLTGAATDWLQTYAYGDNGTPSVNIAPAGGAGMAGASRASDAASSAVANIGGVRFGFANGTGGKAAYAAWGGYDECRKYPSSTGYCAGVEVNITDLTGSPVVINPYNQFQAGSTVGVHVGSGGNCITALKCYDPANGLTDLVAGTASAAILISPNSATYGTPIVIGCGSVSGTDCAGAGTGNFLATYGGANLAWFDTTNSQRFTFGASQSTLVGALNWSDSGLQIGNGSTNLFQFYPDATGVNGFQFRSGLAGASPTITAQGAGADLDVTLTTKGIGAVAPSKLRLTKLAVASLPTCNAGAEGTLYAVTDANSAVFNAAVAAGGANHVMAFCNGTGWTVH